MHIQKAWQIIDELALCSDEEGKITRMAFSKADAAARQRIMELMQDMGLKVRLDSAGNIIGQLAGLVAEAGVVMTGSHLDTVPDDGKYDGVLGVVGGLAAIAILQERGPLTHPVEIIVFAAEEPGRFGIHALGSRAMAGIPLLPTWKKTVDLAGIPLVKVMEEWGLDFEKVGMASRKQEKLAAFIELHVEQGKVLEREDCDIGIVDQIMVPARIKVAFEGLPAHSGVTPMDERRDALVSAAMAILAVKELAENNEYVGAIGTVTNIKVQPGIMNVVPARAEMWIDLYGESHENMIEMIQLLKDELVAIADAQETSVSIEVLAAEKPVVMDSSIKDMLQKICSGKSLSAQILSSGSGHDVMNMARMVPSGMIMVPCRGGFGYSPAESVNYQDFEKGVIVLAEALYQLAK